MKKLKGYIHLLPISKKWEVRYRSNEFTMSCIYVIDEQQFLIPDSYQVKEVEFEIVNIDGIDKAKLLK
jgi:hypothetical protein